MKEEEKELSPFDSVLLEPVDSHEEVSDFHLYANFASDFFIDKLDEEDGEFYQVSHCDNYSSAIMAIHLEGKIDPNAILRVRYKYPKA